MIYGINHQYIQNLNLFTMDDDTGALMDFSNMFKRNRARPSTAKQAEQ
jgi:hypothetical protein